MSVMGIVIAVIGAAVCVAGMVYLVRERDDRDSVRTYGVVAAIGLAVAVLACAGVLG